MVDGKMYRLMSCISRSTASAASLNGTTCCSCPFISFAGMVHVLALLSICDQRAQTDHQ
jgi:hypothetical protein